MTWYLLIYILGGQLKLESYPTETDACSAYAAQISQGAHVYEMSTHYNKPVIKEGECKPVVEFKEKQ